MSDPYFQSLFAERIGGINYGKGTEIYKFEKDQAGQAEGPGRFSRPLAGRLWHRRKRLRWPPSASAARWPTKSTARTTAATWTTATPLSRKPPPGSCSGISASASTPATQVNHCIGSKPALAMLPACFINPGDVTLMTVPGYPVAGTHTQYYGGSVFRLPLLAENDFLPDFAAVPDERLGQDEAARAQLSQQPDRKDRHGGFLRARSSPWPSSRSSSSSRTPPTCMLTYDSNRSASLSVPGAMDVGVEVHSLSQGLRHDRLADRLGLRAERIVRAFADVKDNSDSGQFGAIQNAAAFALDDDSIPVRIRTKYKRRLKKLVAMLSRCGFECQDAGRNVLPLHAVRPRAWPTARSSRTPKPPASI